MTQENKFALIIGFALLLVVGILVSDHLAEVTRGQPANLAVKADPMAGHQPSRVEFQPLLVARGKHTVEAVIPVERHPDTTANLLLHAVAGGETLHAIARMHYGRADVMPLLAAYNNIPNPERLKQGVRLMIPPADVLLASRRQSDKETPTPQSEAGISSEPSVTYATYLVQSGDTLSEIAQQQLGSQARYKEIFEANRDTMASPDQLRVGKAIRIPRL